MPRPDAPYFRPSEIAAAADLRPFIDAACQDAATAEERRDAAAEAVDAIARRGAAPWPVLRILRRLYGLPFAFDPIGA